MPCVEKIIDCSLVVLKNLPGLKNTDSPKSIAFKGELSFLFAYKKFSGLRSRCMTPCLWHICTVKNKESCHDTWNDAKIKLYTVYVKKKLCKEQSRKKKDIALPM
jgi:hypothetical protein